MGVFEIRNKAERMVAADIAEISITFKASGTRTDKVSGSVMDACERFLGEIAELGIEPKDVHISDDEVSSLYNYRNEEKEDARRRLEIVTAVDMKLINSMRSILQKGEYDFIFNVDQRLSNEAELHRELVKEALLKSEQSAQELAASMGMRVESIESLEEVTDESWLCCEQERGIANHEKSADYPKSNELGSRLIKKEAKIKVKWRIN
ncbi:MAG: SIMPL domain-containing protein [Lachnospiraceae bacterium]|nr:SIMPL domain-containing protein [Lachnospiraceae bacterium]